MLDLCFSSVDVSERRRVCEAFGTANTMAYDRERIGPRDRRHGMGSSRASRLCAVYRQYSRLGEALCWRGVWDSDRESMRPRENRTERRYTWYGIIPNKLRLCCAPPIHTPWVGIVLARRLGWRLREQRPRENGADGVCAGHWLSSSNLCSYRAVISQKGAVARSP